MNPFGIITERDIVARVISKNNNTNAMTTSTCMTAGPLTVTRETRIEPFLLLMEDSHVRSVLFVDGMNNHDWPRNTRILKSILETSGRFTVDVSTSPTNDAPQNEWDNWRPAFSKYEVVVNNFNGGYKATDRHWPAALQKDLEDYV